MTLWRNLVQKKSVTFKIVYNKMKIQIFGMNMPFNSSPKVRKCIFHSWLRHSWNMHFHFTRIFIFIPKIWISSISYQKDLLLFFTRMRERELQRRAQEASGLQQNFFACKCYHFIHHFIHHSLQSVGLQIFYQNWWAKVTHGANNGGSFSEMMSPSISN